MVAEVWGITSETEPGARLFWKRCSSGITEGGKYRVKLLKICLDSRRAFSCVIRRAISRPELKDAVERRLFRGSWDLLRDDKLEVVDELEEVEEVPLTCFAHLAMATSSLAAIAPMRPPATKEDEELVEDFVEEDEETISGGSSRTSSSPR